MENALNIICTGCFKNSVPTQVTEEMKNKFYLKHFVSFTLRAKNKYHVLLCTVNV